MRAVDSIHPIALLIWFLSVLAVTMLVSDPVLSAVSLLGALLFWAVTAARAPSRGRFSLIYPILFFTITLTNPLFVHLGDTTLFSLFGIAFTLEALVYGAVTAASVVGVLLWFRICGNLFSGDRVLYLLGCGLPALSLCLSTALRFLPLLGRRMKQVRRAQKTMGLYTDVGRFGKLRAAARGFLSVIEWSLEHAMETAAVMRARGYGTVKRTRYALFRFTVRDGAVLTVSAVLFAVTLCGIATGAVAFTFYPHLGVPNTSPQALTTYLAFGGLTLLPTALEIGETIVWTSCKSKI